MNVGQGILDKMTANGDYPVVDSKFTTNENGTVLETCMGTKGHYYASNASGNWVVFVDPFLG